MTAKIQITVSPAQYARAQETILNLRNLGYDELSCAMAALWDLGAPINDFDRRAYVEHEIVVDWTKADPPSGTISPLKWIEIAREKGRADG